MIHAGDSLPSSLYMILILEFTQQSHGSQEVKLLIKLGKEIIRNLKASAIANQSILNSRLERIHDTWHGASYSKDWSSIAFSSNNNVIIIR